MNSWKINEIGLHSPEQSKVEKKIDIESFEATDDSNMNNIKKFGNRNSYEIKIFYNDDYESCLNDISEFEQIDGSVVKFYYDYENRPNNYCECFFYYMYDDCSRAPIFFNQLYLKRISLEKLSGAITIKNAFHIENGIVGTEFDSNFTGIVNIYHVDGFGLETLLQSGVKIDSGVNYIEINSNIEPRPGLSIAASIKIESTEDYYISGKSEEFFISGGTINAS